MADHSPQNIHTHFPMHACAQSAMGLWLCSPAVPISFTYRLCCFACRVASRLLSLPISIACRLCLSALPVSFACRLCLLPLHMGLPLRRRSSVRVAGKLEPVHAVARWQLSTGGSRPPVPLLQRACLTTACPAPGTLCTITPRYDTSGHGTRGAETTKMQVHKTETYWCPSTRPAPDE